MCKFFSFVMNDKGGIFYFNRGQRLKFKEDNPKEYYMDSHASICEYFNLNEDEVNKYEYNSKLLEDSKCFDLNEEKQKTMDSFIEGLDIIELIVNSDSAYEYCTDVKDDPEIRKLITKSWDAYAYCHNIKDRPEICKLITDSYDAYSYCMNIKDRPEVRKYITESDYAYLYCMDVKDRPEIRKLITESYDAYKYCKHIKDRPEIRKLITDSYPAYFYCTGIKDDPEVRKYITDKGLLKDYDEFSNYKGKIVKSLNINIGEKK